MRRVFAELDEDDKNLWGYFCPFCSLYHEIESPYVVSGKHTCSDCKRYFVVTYAKEQLEARASP